MNLRKMSVVLLALLLAAMAMVPIVYAESQSGQLSGQATGSVASSAPVQYGVFDEPPFAKVTVNPDDNKEQFEFIYALVEQKWLKTEGRTGKDGSITFTVPVSQVHFQKNQAGVPAHVPTAFLDEVKSSDAAVAILWAPTNVVKITKNNDTITITCPEQMLLKFGSLNETKTRLEVANTENLQISGVPQDPSIDVSKMKISPMAAASPSERRWYTATSAINGVTGIMQPAGFSNSGQSFTSYHEMELYLNQPTDAVEYIVYHRTDGRVIDFVSVHDDYALSTPLSMDVTSLSTYLEWYFYIDSGHIWDLYFRNPISGTWYSASHTDTVNLSNTVSSITPSTELYLTSSPPANYFYMLTSPFRVDWTRTTSNTFLSPQQTTIAGSLPPNNQYVQLTTSWDSSGRIVTSQACGSDVS
ncbi:hypothetical protein [Methanoregula sp.]|uniref:hypothetical protein n=1 Tax=Methanoregula sp. TaxID=2052170 RepID=UPI003C75C101